MAVSVQVPFVEADCVLEHEGRSFESGGAVVTDGFVVAYPAAGGVLQDWHGNAIGSWRLVASWPVWSYMGSTMHQIEARVGGVVYTGRGFGVGCIYRGRRKAGQA